MNPFSGFLQPQNNRPLQGLATTQDLLRVVQGNKEMAQRQLENTQQNTRANANLKLQQDYQTHSFEKDAHGRTQEEQKQIEGLLAEYQDAEDQGDPVRLDRASQMLKRFGMDVSQGQQKPNLRAFTGEQALPSLKNPATANTAPGTPANLSDFRQSQPIDDVASEELKTRAALKARSPEQDLSQGDFEEQLINGTQVAPSRYEENGQTTDEFRKMLPQDEPEDLGDVDDPAFKAAAAQESGDVIDLDAESPEPLQIGSAPQEPPAAQSPRRLSTQLLPTVISKGGKQLYESTGPSGRWSPMVAGVFEPYIGHENPQIAAAAKSASQLAQKLIQVDDVPPKEAIKIASDQMMKDAGLTTGLERTKLGTRRSFSGSGGSMAGLLGKNDDRAQPVDTYEDNIRADLIAAGIPKSMENAGIAESALMSGDPALQKDGLKALLLARSGLTVSEGERRSYSGLDGGLSLAKDSLAKWTGQPLSEGTIKALLSVVRNIRQVNQQTAKKISDRAERMYRAQNRDKVAPDRLDERANTLKPIDSEDPNENLYK